MPSPASIDHVAQYINLPPLVAAPDSGIMQQRALDRVERQVPRVHRVQFDEEPPVAVLADVYQVGAGDYGRADRAGDLSGVERCPCRAVEPDRVIASVVDRNQKITGRVGHLRSRVVAVGLPALDQRLALGW